MKHALRKQLIDCSDQNNFIFELICPECGKIWRSKPIRFSKAGEEPATEEKRLILKTLYEREHEHAVRKVLEEAAGFFNVCPICKKAVCDDCFLICDDIDMCRSCAEILHETGEPSSFIGWMTG